LYGPESSCSKPKDIEALRVHFALAYDILRAVDLLLVGVLTMAHHSFPGLPTVASVEGGDNGPGIAADDLAKISDMTFSSTRIVWIPHFHFSR
jgi:hypothetical protein